MKKRKDREKGRRFGKREREESKGRSKGRERRWGERMVVIEREVERGSGGARD